ncbi:MAG: preprotein translocase subunit YajC [Calditrichia bacterium]
MVENLYAMAGGSGGQGGGLLGFLPFLIIIVIMYLLILRPQAKKQKEHQKMLQAVKKGDEVVTSGGIYGKVVGLKNEDKILVVKVDDNVKLDVDRASISRIVRVS